MRVRVAAAVAAAVLAVTATIAVIVAVTVDGSDGPAGVRGEMMSGLPSMGHGARVTTEYGFLAEMVGHHQEAVDSARHLQRSERVQMRTFGESIVATQSAQIEQMQEWLSDWYPDRSGRVDYEPMMRDLSGLSGDRLDRVFLRDMTVHHMAAVMMSQQVLVGGVAEHREVAALARTIRDEQHAEIFQMRRWLQEWFGQGPGMRRDGWMGPGMMRDGMPG